MCTTGALRLSDGSYLMFKNKDFGRDCFEDRLVISAEVFGVEGISTWDRPDSSADEFSGFSLGANRYGLLCSDSNVRGEPPEGTNYDLLTKIALVEGRDVESAIDAVERAVQKRPYWCANLLMVDDEMVAGLDVRGNEIAVECHSDRLTRTNHHLRFGSTPADQDTATSRPRLLSSADRLAKAECLEDILSLQSSHDQGNTGICSHSAYPTVYSYLLHRQPDEIRLLVSQGQPCRIMKRHDLRLPLGDHWSPRGEAELRDGYPSEAAVSAGT